MSVLAALALSALAATLAGDEALVVPAQDIQAHLADLVAQANSTGSAAIASCGNLRLMLNVRTGNGLGEVHQNADDLMIVQEETATLVAGGALVDPKTEGKWRDSRHERAERNFEDDRRRRCGGYSGRRAPPDPGGTRGG